MRLSWILRVLSVMVVIFLACCDDDPTGPARSRDEFMMPGTWIARHITRWDGSGSVTEDYDLDPSQWLSMESFFPDGAMQHLTYRPDIKFLLYLNYTWDDSLMTMVPESLLDYDGVIHIWQPEDSTFLPTCNVYSHEMTVILREEQDTIFVEHRDFDDGEALEFLWYRDSEAPVDLRSYLLDTVLEQVDREGEKYYNWPAMMSGTSKSGE